MGITDIEAQDAELVNDAVRGLREEGEFERARSLLEEVVSRTPNNYINQFEQDGTLYIKFWDGQEVQEYEAWREAEGQTDHVVALINAYPRAYFYIAYLYFEEKDFEKAIHYLDKGLLLQPGYPNLLNEKAQAMIQLGRHQEALGLFDQVLSQSGFVSPHQKAISLRGKGYLLVEEGDLDAAERVFLESLKLEPDSMLAKNELQFIADKRNPRRHKPHLPRIFLI